MSPAPGNSIKLAFPKGRMEKGVQALLADAGVVLRASSRGYRPDVVIPGTPAPVNAKILKPQNIVEMLHAGSDREALLAGLDAVRAKRPDSAIMLISADDAEKKVTIVASVPPPLVAKGLKAGDWVREASAVVGGKGGGRPDAAQGGGTDTTKADEARRVATAFAGSKAG
ncbi:MAG: hypothetical protein J0L61_13105 [Planctomycetes bacterium]|nr:hypothetical protein [Planctomycetota bacterium]